MAKPKSTSKRASTKTKKYWFLDLPTELGKPLGECTRDDFAELIAERNA